MSCLIWTYKMAENVSMIIAVVPRLTTIENNLDILFLIIMGMCIVCKFSALLLSVTFMFSCMIFF